MEIYALVINIGSSFKFVVSAALVSQNMFSSHFARLFHVLIALVRVHIGATFVSIQPCTINQRTFYLNRSTMLSFRNAQSMRDYYMIHDLCDQSSKQTLACTQSILYCADILNSPVCKIYSTPTPLLLHSSHLHTESFTLLV